MPRTRPVVRSRLPSPAAVPAPPADAVLVRSLRSRHRGTADAAAAALLARHAGLVRQLAQRSRTLAPHVDLDDLHQVARIAFLAACRSWNPDSPSRAKLTTYATVCVRRALAREVRRKRHAPLPQAAGGGAADAIGQAARRSGPVDGVDELPAGRAALLDAERVTLLLAHLTPRQRAAVGAAVGLDGRTAVGTDWAAMARRLRVSESRARRLYAAGLDRLRAVVADANAGG